jgi:hypothetical protein
MEQPTIIVSPLKAAIPAQGGHLDLNFDLLLLELRLSKRLRSNKVRLVFAKLVLKSKSKRAYVSFSLNF